MDDLRDTLGTARRIHVLLTVAAVAVMVAAAPMGTDHERALAEIQALRELVSEQGLPTWCARLSEPVFRRAAERAAAEAGREAVPRITGPVECPDPGEGASLEAYHELLIGPFGVRAFVPVPADLATVLEDIPDTGVSGWFHHGGGDAYPRDRLQRSDFFVYSELPLVSGDSGVVELRWFSEDAGSGYTESRIAGAVEPVVGRWRLVLFLDEIQEASYGASAAHERIDLSPLRGRGDFASGEPIPALQSSWVEVRDMTLPEAAAYFRAEAAQGRGGVEVFGLTIDLEILALGGPTVLMFLLVHLLLHLRHVEDIAGDETETFRRFPWIALFRDGSARATAFLSLWVAPVAAGVVVTWRVVEAGPFHAAFAGGATLLTASLGWRVLRELARVRARVVEPGRLGIRAGDVEVATGPAGAA